jgi:hypothetical protein
MKSRDRKRRLVDVTAEYLRTVGRRAQKGQEPNDRGVDHEFEQKLKRMSPKQVDALFREDDD